MRLAIFRTLEFVIQSKLGGFLGAAIMKQAWLLVLSGLFGYADTSAADFATTVAEATFHIVNSDNEGGTCFFVCRPAPDSALYLVSAAHVFEALEKSPATVRLRQRQPDGSYQQPDYPIAMCREGRQLWVRHKTEDVAVLQLSEPPPVPVPALPLTALADEAQFSAIGVHLCSMVFVLTYPAGFPTRDGDFALARQGIIASHPLLPVQRYPTYMVSFTTFAGDSGGPVFLADANGRLRLIGVVVASARQDESVKTEFEERTIHHPFGVGLVVQAQLVRELIEQAAQQAGSDSKKKPPLPDKSSGANAGGLRYFSVRTPPTARVSQLRRSAQ